MSAGRRGILLAASFLVVALWLCPGKRAQAQPRTQPTQPGVRPQDPGAGRHSIWTRELTPEQVRQLLARFGKDDADADDLMHQLLKQALRDRNKEATDEQIDATAKKLMQNKEFRDRVMDLAQKHKNQNPNPNPRPGAPPRRFTDDDLAKLVKLKPEPNGGDPLKVPDKKFDPNELPPFDPRNPNFDPKLFPKIDPDNPPKFDPDTKFPIDPKTDRPFDPRNGQPIDPKNPPRIEQPPPKFDPANPNPGIDPRQPPQPPKVGPMPGQPPEPDDKRKFDPENPLGTPPEPPDKAAKTKAVETATALWEKNVGPIEESPAVKRALIDLVSDPDVMDSLTDDKGNNFFDLFDKDAGNGEKLGDWFKGGEGSNWEWPKFDFNWGPGRNNDLDFGSSRPREPRFTDSGSRSRGSSSLDGMGSFNVGSMQVPWLLFLIILALIVAAVVWWKWGAIFQPKAAAFAGAAALAGGWPIDPREINTREDVVKAFEYLSVLICGPGAKTWTHSTIADELSVLAESDPGTALKLARLYELARYAPLDEPLTRVELLEARRLVCDLAGMDEA
jgi:hypothetical protein